MELKFFSVVWFIISLKGMYNIVNDNNNYLIKISVKYNNKDKFEEDEEEKREKKIRKKLKKMKLQIQKHQIKYEGIPKLIVYLMLVLMGMIPIIINLCGVYAINNVNIDMLPWEFVFLFTGVVLQTYNRIVLCLADIYKTKSFFAIDDIEKIENIEDYPKFFADTFFNSISQFMILYVSVEFLVFVFMTY